MKSSRVLFHCKSLTGGIMLSIIAASQMLAACTTYEPAPAYTPAPSGFDRSWSAATGAARDAGVRVDSEDRSRGVITGTRDGRDVTIAVSTQADGRVRVEISARGPAGSDSNLINEISRAYDRRMGR
ncbi:MAG TPA: penicillin-binding protein [Verrucomicrobiae bacterium]|nr:penicillin-binding protein [Verrucomicrobiae bacterium]